LPGGFLTGSFTVPMKRMTDWRGENTWLIFALFGTILLGWTWAVVGPALFLASDASSMVSGVILPLDGGYLAR
jgi:NAD(P)-dependent dehydrogenase (short-subunit alcohol dehydrogenase family)